MANLLQDHLGMLGSAAKCPIRIAAGARMAGRCVVGGRLVPFGTACLGVALAVVTVMAASAMVGIEPGPATFGGPNEGTGIATGWVPDWMSAAGLAVSMWPQWYAHGEPDPSAPVLIIPADSITEFALDGANSITTFEKEGRIIAAVASVDGVQLLDVTDPDNIVARDAIAGDSLALSFANSITTFEREGRTIAAVSGLKGVQLLDVTDPDNIVARAAIADDSLLLDGANSITTFERERAALSPPYMGLKESSCLTSPTRATSSPGMPSPTTPSRSASPT